MIGATTTVELSPTGIDGDGFDLFSSLRDGSGGEDFSSGISEEVADSVEQFDLVAVAGGKAEIDVTMSDDKTEEYSVPIDPERCRNFGTVACLGCVNLGLCQDRQAAMMEKNNNLQPEEQLSTLEQLLREDEAPGEIVWAQVVPETDEAGDLGQTEEVPEAASPNVMEVILGGENITEEDDGSKEQTSNVHDEEDFKAAETTIEVAKDAGVDDYVAKPQVTNPILDEPAEMSEQLTSEDKVVLPTPMAAETKPVAPAAENVPSRETLLDNTTVDHAGDYDNSCHTVCEPEEKSAPPVAEQESSVQMSDTPVNVPMENAKHEMPAKELVAVEELMSAREQPDQSVIMMSPIQDNVEYGEEVPSVSEEPAVDHSPTQPTVVDIPVVHEVVEVASTGGVAIERGVMDLGISIDAVVDEDELWTDLSQDGSQEVAVDQIVYGEQFSPVEQLDDVVMEKRSCDTDEETWSEEDVVLFVEQPLVVESEAPLAEAVITDPLAEATIMTGEKIYEPEVFVADEVEIKSVELLDNLQLASAPETTKDDHESMEQSVVPASSIIEPVSHATLDETLVQMPEEYALPCEKQDNVIKTTPEGNDLWLGGDELESMAMDVSDAEQSGDLSEEQEDPALNTEAVGVAESELDKQNDLMIGNDTLDDCAYNGEESVANGDDLLMNTHPSSGLWPDDSPLNPENDKTSNDNTTNVVSWLAKLVGAVAVYVACNRRESVVSL